VIRTAFAAGLVAVVAATAGANAGPRLDPCPAKNSVKAVYDASAATAGGFRAIKRIFPRMNYGQGRTTPVTRRTTHIREVVELNRASPDALHFRRLASRRCGVPTALRSWAVVAQFPLAPMATTSQIAVLIVDTKTGWKLYDSVLDTHSRRAVARTSVPE
jgi:hypothetical protein